MAEKLKNILLISLTIYAIYQHGHIQHLEKATPVSSLAEGNTIQVEEVQAQEDKRVEALEDFFTHYQSPLAESAATFVEVADQYGMDWTLLPAIASQESGFGKKTPSCASYNPFGWTSTTSPCGFWRFESFDDSIRTVAQRISELSAYSDFRASGEIQDIAKKYNSEQTDEWISKVTYFQEIIKNGR